MKKFKTFTVKIDEAILARYDEMVKSDESNRNRSIVEGMKGEIQAWEESDDYEDNKKEVTPKLNNTPKQVTPNTTYETSEKMALIANLKKKSEEVMDRKPTSAVEHNGAFEELTKLVKTTEQFCFENDIENEGLLNRAQRDWIKEHSEMLMERYSERISALPIKSDGTLDGRYKDDVEPFVRGFQGSAFKVNGEKKRKAWKKKEAE